MSGHHQTVSSYIKYIILSTMVVWPDWKRQEKTSWRPCKTSLLYVQKCWWIECRISSCRTFTVLHVNVWCKEPRVPNTAERYIILYFCHIKYIKQDSFSYHNYWDTSMKNSYVIAIHLAFLIEIYCFEKNKSGFRETHCGACTGQWLSSTTCICITLSSPLHLLALPSA